MLDRDVVALLRNGESESPRGNTDWNLPGAFPGNGGHGQRASSTQRRRRFYLDEHIRHGTGAHILRDASRISKTEL